MNDDPIIKGADFMAELGQRGFLGCPACGHPEIVSFGVDGELEPLFLMTRSQVLGQLQVAATEDSSILGKKVYALTCNNCSFMPMWDAAAFRGTSGADAG